MVLKVVKPHEAAVTSHDRSGEDMRLNVASQEWVVVDVMTMGVISHNPMSSLLTSRPVGSLTLPWIGYGCAQHTRANVGAETTTNCRAVAHRQVWNNVTSENMRRPCWVAAGAMVKSKINNPVVGVDYPKALTDAGVEVLLNMNVNGDLIRVQVTDNSRW